MCSLSLCYWLYQKRNGDESNATEDCSEINWRTQDYDNFLQAPSLRQCRRLYRWVHGQCKSDEITYTLEIIDINLVMNVGSCFLKFQSIFRNELKTSSKLRASYY